MNLEPLDQHPLATLPDHVVAMKLENDTIQAMALARPRCRESILADLRSQVEQYPNFAAAAVYCRPVGKMRRVVCACGHAFDAPLRGKLVCPQCQQSKTASVRERMKLARGLSIRAAEALAEVYRYNRVRADITPLDNDRIKVEATFTDFQQGRIWQSAGIVARKYKDADGATREHDEQRFYSTVVKAEISRQIREVITRSIPPGLRAELQELCERQSAATLTPEKMQQIVAFFAEKGVTLAQLEEYLGRTQAQGWTNEDRVDLMGIATALKDGELTSDEVFGVPSDASRTKSKVAESELGDGRRK